MEAEYRPSWDTSRGHNFSGNNLFYDLYPQKVHQVLKDPRKPFMASAGKGKEQSFRIQTQNLLHDKGLHCTLPSRSYNSVLHPEELWDTYCLWAGVLREAKVNLWSSNRTLEKFEAWSNLAMANIRHIPITSLININLAQMVYIYLSH